MSEKDRDLGELTAYIARQIRRRSKKLPLAPHQARALRIIVDGPIRPARLAEVLRVTPRAITDVVDALTGLGLVDVGADPEDRRAKIVTATPAAHDYLESTRAARAQISAEMFGVLSAEEQRQLRIMLEKVLDNDRDDSDRDDRINRHE